MSAPTRPSEHPAPHVVEELDGMAMGGSVVVRRLRQDEVDRYRELRLQSLLDSPEAFTATWEQESAMPQSEWSARVEGSVTGRAAIVVAEHDQRLIGLAGGIPAGNRARVVGVWVAPGWARRARQVLFAQG